MLPSSKFRDLSLSLFDVDEDIVGGAGNESYKVLGGCYLTIETPFNPEEFASSRQLFYVSANTDHTLLSLNCLKELGVVKFDFPKIAPLKVNKECQFIFHFHS